MKPKNWDTMDHKAQHDMALELLQSIRGRLLMGQALHYAIKSLKAVEPPIMQERSNIEDMEMISTLFEPFFSLYTTGKVALDKDDANLQ